jgi:hypothetical protein
MEVACSTVAADWQWSCSRRKKQNMVMITDSVWGPFVAAEQPGPSEEDDALDLCNLQIKQLCIAALVLHSNPAVSYKIL